MSSSHEAAWHKEIPAGTVAHGHSEKISVPDTDSDLDPRGSVLKWLPRKQIRNRIGNTDNGSGSKAAKVTSKKEKI